MKKAFSANEYETLAMKDKGFLEYLQKWAVDHFKGKLKTENRHLRAEVKRLKEAISSSTAVLKVVDPVEVPELREHHFAVPMGAGYFIQVKAGSRQWEPSAEQLDALCKATCSGVEKLLSKDQQYIVLATRHDVKVEALKLKTPRKRKSRRR